MQNNIDLTQISDIAQLKAMKLEQYDTRAAFIAGYKSTLAIMDANIDAFTNRIDQLTSGGLSTAAGSAQMHPVELEVTTPNETA